LQGGGAQRGQAGLAAGVAGIVRQAEAVDHGAGDGAGAGDAGLALGEGVEVDRDGEGLVGAGGRVRPQEIELDDRHGGVAFLQQGEGAGGDQHGQCRHAADEVAAAPESEEGGDGDALAMLAGREGRQAFTQ
jgi:hypothetical protein